MILSFVVLILNLHFHIFPYLVVSKMNYFLTASRYFLFSVMNGWGQSLCMQLSRHYAVKMESMTITLL